MTPVVKSRDTRAEVDQNFVAQRSFRSVQSLRFLVPSKMSRDSGEAEIGENGDDYSNIPSRPLRFTGFGRLLIELSTGDAIGMLQAVDQAIQHLDNVEFIEETQQQATQSEKIVGTANEGKMSAPYQYVSEDEADAGPGLRTNQDIVAALSSEKPTAPKSRDISCVSENLSPETSAPDMGPRKRVVVKRAVHARVRRKKRDGAEEELQDSSGGGIFGSNQGPPVGAGLSKYFAAVGSTHEKRVVALSAWMLTIIGLLFCLVFVTKDFLQSKKDATTALSLEPQESLDIPNTYICSTQIAFPAFQHYPGKQYPGNPFLWLSALRMPGNRSIQVLYPTTQYHENIDFVTIDMYGDKCKSTATTYADSESIWKTTSVPPKCFNCILVKSSPPIRILRSDVHDKVNISASEAAVETSFEIEVSQSILIEACRGTKSGMATYPLLALRNMVLPQAGALRQRGTLDFGEGNPTNLDDYKEYFPLRRIRGEHGYTDPFVTDVVDVFCNSALFSGFFYPVSPSQGRVSFKYDDTLKRWARKKEAPGPYYPPRFEDWYNQPEISNGTITQNQTIVQKVLPATPSLDAFSKSPAGKFLKGTLLKVLVESPHGKGAPLRQLSAIEDQGVSTVFFVKHSNNNNISHSYVRNTVTTKTIYGVNINNNYIIRLTSQDFNERKVTSQKTVQATSFLADFFGLIELFLDLSVYTLIVSPIMVSARRKATLSALRSAAAPISPV